MPEDGDAHLLMRKDLQQIVVLIQVLFSELGDFLEQFVQLSLDPVDSFVEGFGNQGHGSLTRRGSLGQGGARSVYTVGTRQCERGARRDSWCLALAAGLSVGRVEVSAYL
jgi:hypothetical protein